MSSLVMQAEPESEMLPGTEMGGIAIQAVPGRSRVLCGAKTTARVVFRIVTPASNESTAKRPPLHVACVLDSSGSMHGQSLDYAKKAVKKLVKHLSPDDVLHFITYDSKARIVFQDGDLAEAGMIDAVRANGQTNLCGGLELAVQVLMNGQTSTGGATSGGGFLSSSRASSKEANSSAKRASDGIVRRIFLFSDGCVNQGVTDPQQIRRKVAGWAEAGITTGTFGIGTHFDENLMRGIAEAGQGRYKFLATSQDIPKIVSKSVHGLLDLFASEVTLDLRGGEHTTVMRVYGGDDEDEDATADAPGLMHLGDLHNANVRLVLAELEVAPNGSTREGEVFSAAEWTLSGQRHGAPMQLSGEVRLQVTRDRTSLGIEVSAVRTAFAIRRAGEMDLEVAESLGCRDRQRARDVKARQLALLRETLEAARQDEAEAPGDVEMLMHVIERAEKVAEQLDNEFEDVELVRRQCVQECELNCQMSCASFGNRSDSSPGGNDIANLRDLDGMSPPGSPRSYSPTQSPRSGSPHLSVGSRTPPLSPRNGSPLQLSSDGNSTCSSGSVNARRKHGPGPVTRFLGRLCSRV